MGKWVGVFFSEPCGGDRTEAVFAREAKGQSVEIRAQWFAFFDEQMQVAIAANVKITAERIWIFIRI
jgi:hypothetical protein